MMVALGFTSVPVEYCESLPVTAFEISLSKEPPTLRFQTKAYSDFFFEKIAKKLLQLGRAMFLSL